MKAFKTILFVILAIVMIAVAVVYFLDTPVIPEGAEPTVAQKILIAAKEKLGVILSALGVSAVGLIAFLCKKILNGATSTDAASKLALSEISKVADTIQDYGKSLEELKKKVGVLTEKQDIASTSSFDIYLMSDLPAPVRAEIYKAKQEYEALCAAKAEVEQEVATLQQTAAEVAEAAKTAPTTVEEESEKKSASAPAYFG